MVSVYKKARGATDASLDELLAAIRGCGACESHLPLGPRPAVQAYVAARILIVGQAPGLRVHTTGIPWAQRHFLRSRRKRSLTETTKAWRDYSPHLFSFATLVAA